MGYENYSKSETCSSEQLIFPMKTQKGGDKCIDRVSEQELRLLFIEEFKKSYSNFFYSIETPTKLKYSLGRSYKNMKVTKNGQSALIDLCVFERKNNEYQRVLNIEFKNKNTTIESIGKDILKLISEEHDGVFIHLLQNTDSGTFCNTKQTGVFNKLQKSFFEFQANWNNKQKSILLVIISLSQECLIYRKLKKSDLKDLFKIFLSEGGNIKEVKGNGWKLAQNNG